jgi:hypothetical protein
MIRHTRKPKITLSNRPKRDKIIQRDEIVSLKIDLNLLSVDEFIAKHCKKKYPPHIKDVFYDY